MPSPKAQPAPPPGTVVSTFMELLDEDSGMTGPVERPLTAEQRRWVYTQQVLQTSSMVTLYTAPVEGSFIRFKRFCFRLCTAREQVHNPEKKAYFGNGFNGGIMGVIVFNIVMMLIKSDEQGDSTKNLYVMVSTVLSNPTPTIPNLLTLTLTLTLTPTPTPTPTLILTLTLTLTLPSPYP